MTVVRRKSDGTLWKVSYNPSSPMIGIFDQSKAFYFEGLHEQIGWRRIFGRLRSNGKIWEHGDYRAFDIVTKS